MVERVPDKNEAVGPIPTTRTMSKEGEKHFFGNVNQKALIRKEGKILLVHYGENDVKNHPFASRGKWDFPGGRLNQNENVHDALRREVAEELGVGIVIKGIIATGTFVNNNGVPNYFVLYDTELSEPGAQFKFQDTEVDKVAWIEPGEFFALPIIYKEYQEALKSVSI